MCYLLALPAGVQPELEWLLNSLVSNNDGAGFTIATKTGQLITEHAIGITDDQSTSWTGQDGKVRTYYKVSVDKTPMEDLARRFIKLRLRHPDGPALWHARLATGGVEDTRGCHPYKCGNKENPMPGTVLAHNGIMFASPAGDWRSDTRIFAEDMLPKSFRKFWRQDVRDRMEQYLGLGNKVAIITVNPRFMTRVKGGLSSAKSELFIFNEDLGHWHKNAWHSNSSYAAFKSYGGYKTGTTYQTGGGWKGHGNFNNGGWDYENDDEWSGYGTGTSGYTTQAERDEKEANGEALTCDLCGSIGAVDVFTEICQICKTCNGCTYDELNCDCYNPHRASQPASIPSVPADQVEPKELDAGQEFMAFRSQCFDEWDESTDPAVRAMTWGQYIMLREYEERHNVSLRFTSIDHLKEWLAEQEAVSQIMKGETDWVFHVVDEAKEDAANAAGLVDEVNDMLSDLDRGEGGAFEASEDGIIRRLA